MIDWTAVFVGMLEAYKNIDGMASAWRRLVAVRPDSLLLLRVSGVALLEKDIGERRPAYREYIERTNAFFPGPQRSEGAQPQSEGALVLGVPRDEVGGRPQREAAEQRNAERGAAAGRGRGQRLADRHAEQRGAEPDDERHGAEGAEGAGVRVARQRHRRARVEQGARRRHPVPQHGGRGGQERGDRGRRGRAVK